MPVVILTATQLMCTKVWRTFRVLHTYKRTYGAGGMFFRGVFFSLHMRCDSGKEWAFISNMLNERFGPRWGNASGRDWFYDRGAAAAITLTKQMPTCFYKSLAQMVSPPLLCAQMCLRRAKATRPSNHTLISAVIIIM